MVYFSAGAVTGISRPLFLTFTIMTLTIKDGKVILNNYVLGDVIRHDIPNKTITYEVHFLGEYEEKTITYDLTTTT